MGSWELHGVFILSFFSFWCSFQLEFIYNFTLKGITFLLKCLIYLQLINLNSFKLCLYCSSLKTNFLGMLSTLFRKLRPYNGAKCPTKWATDLWNDKEDLTSDFAHIHLSRCSCSCKFGFLSEQSLVVLCICTNGMLLISTCINTVYQNNNHHPDQ